LNWSARIIEQQIGNKIIRPLPDCVGPQKNAPFEPLSQRATVDRSHGDHLRRTECPTSLPPNYLLNLLANASAGF
jgi:hypothetical protein